MARLAAIFDSLKTVNNIPSQLQNVAIFSDFQTALKFMKTKTWNPTETDLRYIRKLTDSLSKKNIKATFQNIPSHIGTH